MSKDYGSWSVAALKQELQKRNAKITGKKAMLVQREMRRKSERQSSRKSKASPEKKNEKSKRARTSKRRKDSTSSDNDSGNEEQESKVEVVEQLEKKSPTKVQTPVKEDPSDEKQDQVWQVKTEGSSDSGEIQKLKLCLTRPSSTPERPDRSPRSKRKSSRTTSSSDTASVECVEEKKKSKHRSKRLDKDSDKSEVPDDETEQQSTAGDNKPEEGQIDASEIEATDNDVPMSTSKIVEESDHRLEVSTSNDNEVQDTEISESKSAECENKESENKSENTQSESTEPNKLSIESSSLSESYKETDPPIQETKVETTGSASESQEQNLHSSDGAESKEVNTGETVKENSECATEESNDQEKQCTEEKTDKTRMNDEYSCCIQQSTEKKKYELFKEQSTQKVSTVVEPIESDSVKSPKESETTTNDEMIAEQENAKVKLSDNLTEKNEHFQDIKNDNEQNQSIDSRIKETEDTATVFKNKVLERSTSRESCTQNGQSSTPVMNRKRRWGARPTKIATQKSVSISTDVLKDIIPDVKPVEFDEVIEEKKHHKRIESIDKIERPILPKIVIDNTEHIDQKKERYEMEKENHLDKETLPLANRKISIVKENDSLLVRPPSPSRHKTSNVLYITNLVRPFTLPQLKNLLQRTGRIMDGGFWIDRIKSKCYVKYETEDQAIETRHALHGVTWPVSNPKTLLVDFSNEEAFEKAKETEETNAVQTSTIPGTVEDWIREQDLKRERGQVEDTTRPWEKRNTVREWDVGKGVMEKQREREKEQRGRREERPPDKRRHRTPERSPEPAKKFKKKEEEAPAKMLDDLFRKTKTTPCIYWLPLSAETIAIKEEQRRQHMAEHERRMQELRHARAHRRR